MSHQGLDAYLCCIDGAAQYAVRGGAVRLVARAEQLRGSGADGRAGVLPFGGADVPVYSLAGLLGGGRDVRTADRHIVVTGDGGAAIGLLVDRVVRASLGRGRELSLPAIAGEDAARWFAALLTLEETSSLVLNPEGLRPGSLPRTPAPLSAVARKVRAADVIDDLVFVFSSAALPPCDGARHAVHAGRLAAIVQSMSSVPLPGCARHVSALGAWRNVAVPVIDYSRGAIATRTARRFAVLRAGGATMVALPINADAVLRRATADDAPAANQAPPAYVRGIFQSGGERVALLDLERVAGGLCAAPVSTHAGVPALV